MDKEKRENRQNGATHFIDHVSNESHCVHYIKGASFL